MRLSQRFWVRAGVLAAAVLSVGSVVAFGMDDGHAVRRPRLLSGAAWLSSARVGQVTLLDGASAEVSAQVRVAPAGDSLDVVQHGSTAYAVDRTAGTVRRVDGATFELTQPESPIPDARGGLVAIPGPDSLYTLDIERGVLAQNDPSTLARRGDLITLTARLGAGTAAVDEAGRLWAVDTGSGDVVRIAGGRRTVQRQVVQQGRSLLTLAAGAPVVVDTVGRKAITLDPDTGRTRATMELDLRPDDEIEVGGSPRASRLYVAVSRGALYVCELVASSCETVIPLAKGTLGAPVEAAGRVFVPDYGTGQVWVVDLTRHAVVAKPRVLDPAGEFQLLTRDGIVFYNDLNSERAGVIHLDGTVTSTAKYDPTDPSKGVRSPDVSPGPPDQPSTPDASAPPRPDEPPSNPAEPPRTPSNPQQPRPNPNPEPNPQPNPNPNPNPQPPVNLRISLSNTDPVVGEPVTLRVTNPDGPAPASAQWDFGDGGQGADATTEHAWATAKTYQVSVRAAFPDGRSSTASVSLTVKAKPMFTLTVNVPAGGGTITGGGINCPGTCTAEFDPDAHQTIALTAVEDANHLQGTWSGACSGTGETCNVTMDGTKTVGYTFRERDPTVTYTIIAAAGGTISVDSATCPGTCTYEANRGQNVDFRATPDATHDFDTWIDGCANQTVPSCTTHSETDRTVSARFKPKKFTLTIALAGDGQPDAWVDGTGGIHCTNRCTYDYDPNNTVVTLTQRTTQPPPQTCAPSFLGWFDDCAPAARQDNCVLTINGNKSVVAQFRRSGC